MAIVATAVLGHQAPPAEAKGNASAAIGFLERAQNEDGGFGARRGGGSTPAASAWAAVALLASGKHPRDSWVKGGDSLESYLREHRSDYGNLGGARGSWGPGGRPRRARGPRALG
jgi:hypothetical protein